ncbi:MAG: hypothetical protein ABJA74_11890 [Lapillicoccus sp.]
MTEVQRVQTGLRIDGSLVKVLKGLAEYLDMSLGNLVEAVVLHAFEQRSPFSDETVAVVEQLRKVYGLTLTAEDSHGILAAEGRL